MVILYHHDNHITQTQVDNHFTKMNCSTIASGLLELAEKYPNEILVWCHEELQDFLDTEQIKTLFHHKKMLFSYHTGSQNRLNPGIGYVEESIFIKVNKTVTYPTWQMSSDVGAVHASVLLAVASELNLKDNLDYFLLSFAKRAMQSGLLCYSEPKLIRQRAVVSRKPESGKSELFRFVKQHYKTRWIFLLLFNFIWNERSFPFAAFLNASFYSKRKWLNHSLEKMIVHSEKRQPADRSIDVIIPTIGRKQHLYNVLKDLAIQTHLPVNVIVVEQNPQPESQSELYFISNETWPFSIKHIFTHQAGACNARNLCLSHTKSNYVFLADDDNRFEPDLIEKVFTKFAQFGNEVFQIAYPQANENIVAKPVIQYPFFGAGNAFLKRSCLQDVAFDMGFEFGYGEDNDFGMQLRNHGFDVLYVSDFKIIHLKAPMGGFRTKPVRPWNQEKVQPKPSPTIMLYLLKNYTGHQLAGYKTNLFFKFYKSQSVKNPYKYKRIFDQQWNSSIFWAKKNIKES